MSKIQEDIDLIEFLILLWSHKWIIVFSAFIFGILFSTYHFMKNNTKVDEGPIFKSKMMYKPNDRLPLQYNKFMVMTDFEELFFSTDLFNSWKSANNQSDITFEEIKKTQLNEGTLFSKEVNNQPVIFVNSNNNENHHLRLITNKISSITEIYEYSNFVNDLLTSKLMSYAKNEYKMIVEKYKEYNSTHTDHPTAGYIYNLMEIDRYFNSVNEGEKALIIEPPSVPVNSNKPIKFSLIKLCITLVLGGIVGAFLTILKDAIYKRKNQL